MFDKIKGIFRKDKTPEILHYESKFDDVSYCPETGKAVSQMKLHIRTADGEIYAKDFLEEKFDMRELKGMQIGYLYFEFLRLTKAGEEAVKRLLFTICTTERLNIPTVINYLKKNRIAFQLKFSPIECLPDELNAGLYFREFMPFYVQCKENGLLV